MQIFCIVYYEAKNDKTVILRMTMTMSMNYDYDFILMVKDKNRNADDLSVINYFIV